MHPSGTASSPRESGLPARNERHSPVWRPLLLGAWVRGTGSSDSETPPETGIRLRLVKKWIGHKKSLIVQLYWLDLPAGRMPHCWTETGSQMSATGISLMHAGPNRGGSQARIDHGARIHVLSACGAAAPPRAAPPPPPPPPPRAAAAPPPPPAAPPRRRRGGGLLRAAIARQPLGIKGGAGPPSQITRTLLPARLPP
jgi:hypothetical protein